MTAPLVLASRSPRRIELLRALGLNFDVVPSAVEEHIIPGLSHDELAIETARQKAEDVARQFPRRIVLGADTIVCLDDAILGKPADPADARRILRTLRGREHRVITGLCIIGPDQPVWTAAEITRVRMHHFSDEALERYVAGGEPMDKAGAYGIQGGAADFIASLVGDYFNVVGLPLSLLLEGLSRFMPTEALHIPAAPPRFASSADNTP
ncbi:MAG: Maf family protein [Candidatus Sumerlaeia bacterium]|nr:Maf family protein [Candidatus Sumerlaeia bacterium]